MRSGPTLIVFHGNAGSGPAEALLAAARIAAARHTIAAALAGGCVRAIVATDDPVAFEGLGPRVEVDPDLPGAPFDFLARLRHLVSCHAIEAPIVMGSGSLPLLDGADFAAIVAALDEGSLVTNNLFSGDLTAWTPGSAIAAISDVARDNVLPRRLRDQAGLSPKVLPRSTKTLFDIDTPADLAVLALREGLPFALPPPDGFPLEAYRAVGRVICNPKAELCVAGRVSSSAWQYLETETACRVRLLSEERGLAAAGPGHRARSALGFLLESVGVERFFEHLAELGDAIVLDTRVIEAHLGLEPSREDRFQSDLLATTAIKDPVLREFTAAAAGCRVPVLLGGHSLVSGGLMALADGAWIENDRLTGALRL